MGNAIVDLFVGVDEDQFAALGFERGTMRLVEAGEQAGILEAFHAIGPRLVSGGSVANSVIAFAQLGGRAAFIGIVGDDRYGLHYQSEFRELGIAMGNPVLAGQTTGTCVAVITPDAERTMRTHLGVNALLSGMHVRADADLIRDSAWLFIEGYLFANPGTGQEAIREAVAIAREHGTKIAITCSEAFIVQVFGTALHEALKHADMFFCNASEANAVTNSADAAEAFRRMSDVVPNCVVTDGPNGAYVRWHGTEHHVAAVACEPRDLTGAGDMFAGSFLFGVLHGMPPETAARGANYLAMKVITQVGARLHTDVREAWHSHAV